MSSKWIKNVTREVTIFPAQGVTKSLGLTSKAFNIPFSYKHTLFVDSTWYYQEEDYKQIQQIFKKIIQKDPGFIIKTQSKQTKSGENLKKYCKSIAKKKFSRKKLATEILKYDEKMTNFYSNWWVAIPSGEVLEEIVKDLLNKKRSKLKFEELMFVREELELVREKRLRSLIGIECKNFSTFESLPVKLRAKLKNHADSFGWISTSYHVGILLTAKDFFDKIKSEDSAATLKQIMEEKNKQKEILKLISKNFSKSEQKLIRAMQAIMYLRNYQKETVNECQHFSEPFLKQVAQSLGVELKTALSFLPNELNKYLSTNINSTKELEEIAANRAKGYVLEYKDKAISIKTKIKEYQTLVAGEAIDLQVQEIKGSPACQGKATGKVRLVLNNKEIANFVEGEVLVTIMTSVEYIHIMKKACAIITDEGGITCHAAIFSREFNVPCVIGTKIATKVLKNNDIVEVDATKGLIKIISKAKGN